MEISLLIAFLLAALALTFMPGPDNIFVLTESLHKGSRTGIWLAAGLASGVLVHTTLAATGLALLIKQSVLLFSFIKYAGAIYLAYLAIMAAKEASGGLAVVQQNSAPGQSATGLWRKGFLMNVLNPKVSLFFLAFLPQFVSEQGWSPFWQMYFLGGLFMLQAFVIFGLIAFLAGRFSPYLNRAGFWKITKWFKVTVLGLLAVALLVF